MDELIKHTPGIIEAAAKSTLGIFALMIIALSVLGYLFFHKSSERTRAAIFVLMFVGVVTFGFALLQSGTTDGQVADQTLIPDDPSESVEQDVPPVINLRSEPARLSLDMLKVLLVRHGFYDKRWNPAGKGIAHRYEPHIQGNKVLLIDRATGLMWQKGGGSRMTFDKAEQYIREMNTSRFAGFSDWRLPTAEEAMSLMEQEAHDDFHIDPAFERGINFIWTSDRADEGYAWVVYFYDGRIVPEPEAFNARVRAVRGFD